MGWKPKNPPQGYAIAPPDNDYWDRETAREWGVTLDEWYRKDPVYRAEMIAHSMERHLRKAHFSDWEIGKSKERAKTEGAPEDPKPGRGSDPLNRFRNAWGVPM
ncbi:MAG: hypothetical protein ACYDC1_06360 [Limisphaerales bacterium]